MLILNEIKQISIKAYSWFKLNKKFCFIIKLVSYFLFIYGKVEMSCKPSSIYLGFHRFLLKVEQVCEEVSEKVAEIKVLRDFCSGNFWLRKTKVQASVTKLFNKYYLIFNNTDFCRVNWTK